MASLSSALNFALAGLSVSTVQSALVSRNISSAGDENYAHRTAEIQALPGGAPGVSGIRRSTDRQVLDKLLLANSEAAGKDVMLGALTRLGNLGGDPQDDQSIASAIGQLQAALRGYEVNPASSALGRKALEAARSVALKINSAAAEASSIRAGADTAMAEATERVNNLLAQFKVVNDGIIRGEGTPDELSENLDQRDGILKLLSEEIGIRTSSRPNNDMQIYAEGGAVLFEGSPRLVNFAASDELQPGMPGGALYIDGVAVTGPDAPMPMRSGRIAALAMVRDGTAVQFSRQLDQIAAGLIRGFAERDQSTPSSLPDVEGLFMASGVLPALPGENAGLSSLIRLNSLADPDQGGSVFLLRDGGFGGASYVSNTLARPSFQSRIAELSDAIDSPRSFGSLSGVGGTISLKELSLQSASWLGGLHQSAQSSFDQANATRTRAGESMARITGVNIDHEMAALLDLEKSYQASSKVLSVVNNMMSVLMEVVG